MLYITLGVLICVVFVVGPVLMFMKKATNVKGGTNVIDPKPEKTYQHKK
ncbi:hypothetical protein [Lysinibacillus sp. BF-4]|uniref:Uncharacterized protein n=1 Tax=Metalysinibacillus saudimassiliensis TaxID=1461583 RepID=A0A078MK18_9BACL|nr:hypothetical protein [Lysinibacillus sp. BF-4]CEA05091.1 hypothetical protein BN1050_02300 [Metalysinibacillus saudimassiliensis]